MHVNPNTNDAWKNGLVMNLKTENFPVSISQKELSINQRNFLEIFHRSIINQALIIRGSEFWTQKFIVSISQERFSIGRIM